ncbi:hypothetical protein AB0L13_44745 [Saccharopolyspora shandongensis]|uniref:hypothetical protein n=1 Tax=Saccharopolyspora shandongensis TaxID=418495 RepID=UPI0034244006
MVVVNGAAGGKRVSHPLLSAPRSFFEEAAEIEAVKWVASPSESTVHVELPGTGYLACGHELADEPETWTGSLPASRWPHYQPHLACLANVPAWVSDLAEPRMPQPYKETVMGRHAVETMATLRMQNLVRNIQAYALAVAGRPSVSDNEGVPGSSYLPGTRRKCIGTPAADSTTPHDLGEVA